MKNSSGISLQKASRLAEKLYENAKLHSAYDSHGHLLFLIANVSCSDFVRLYGSTAFACVLIDGRWVVFYRHGPRICVVEKSWGQTLQVLIKKDPVGWGKLLVQHKGKSIFSRLLVPEEVVDFKMNSALLQKIAKVYVSYFSSTRRFADTGRSLGNGVAIHILPELADADDFVAEAVDLQ